MRTLIYNYVALGRGLLQSLQQASLPSSSHLPPPPSHPPHHSPPPHLLPTPKSGRLIWPQWQWAWVMPHGAVRDFGWRSVHFRAVTLLPNYCYRLWLALCALSYSHTAHVTARDCGWHSVHCRAVTLSHVTATDCGWRSVHCHAVSLLPCYCYRLWLALCALSCSLTVPMLLLQTVAGALCTVMQSHCSCYCYRLWLALCALSCSHTAHVTATDCGWCSVHCHAVTLSHATP